MANNRTQKKPLVKKDVSGVAHDMTTPISVIKSFLETISIEDQENQEFHLAAKRSLDKLMGLVESLSEFGCSSESVFSHTNIVQIIRSAMAIVAPIAKKKEIGIHFVGPTVFTVYANPLRLDRAITNLILNAVEASAEGSEVRVEIATVENFVTIAVVDCGCGIDERYLSRVFERGFTKGKKHGSGIGLDLCRQIVCEHGGSIEAFSKKGRGSVFAIILPKYVVSGSSYLYFDCSVAPTPQRQSLGREDTF